MQYHREHQRNFALDMAIAKAIYGHDMMLLDSWGTGICVPHFTGKFILGGSKHKARTLDDTVIEIFSRPCPPYSYSIDSAYELLWYLRTEHDAVRDTQNIWNSVRVELQMNPIPFDEDAPIVAKHICQMILEALNGRTFTPPQATATTAPERPEGTEPTL